MTESKEKSNVELKGFNLEIPEAKVRIEGGKTYISVPPVIAHNVQITIETGKVSISGSLQSGHEPEKSSGVMDCEAQGGESPVKRIGGLEEGDRASVYLFTLGLGFAVLTIALSLLLAFNSLKDNFGVGPLLVVIAFLAFAGFAIALSSKGMDILEEAYDGTQAAPYGKCAKRIIPYSFVIGVALAFAGSGVRQWSHTAGNWVAVAGLIGFIAVLAWMFRFRKSRHAAQQPKP